VDEATGFGSLLTCLLAPGLAGYLCGRYGPRQTNKVIVQLVNGHVLRGSSERSQLLIADCPLCVRDARLSGDGQQTQSVGDVLVDRSEIRMIRLAG